MFLGDIFLSNLIDRRERLRQAMFFLTIGAAAVSVVALLQMLCIKLKIPFPIPFWKDVDHFIFKFLPFSIVTDFVSTRASATFDNPLILAAYLIIIFYRFQSTAYLSSRRNGSESRQAFAFF